MKTLDITDRLKFEESPVLVIKGEKITVKDDAITVLSLMELLGDEPDNESMIQASKLMFSEEDFSKLGKMNLSFTDFSKVIECAINLITGDDEGEQ